MDQCGACQQPTFPGQPCVRCGTVTGGPPPPAPVEAAAAEEPLGALGALKIGVPLVVIVGLVGALIFSLAYGSRAPSPEQLALFETTLPQLDATSPRWCDHPQPVEGVEPLSTRVANPAVAHESVRGATWTASSFDGLEAAAWRSNPALMDETVEDVRAVVCLELAPNGQDRVCTGYDGALRVTVWGYDLTATVYEVATAEEVERVTVRPSGDDYRCPDAVLASGDEASERADLPASALVAALAPILSPQPTTYDVVAALEQGWCASPTTLVGSSVGGASLLAAVGQVNLHDSDVRMAMWPGAPPTHIVCGDLAVTGDLACGQDIVPTGELTLRIVDAATGAVVGEHVGPSSTECPATVLGGVPTPGPDGLEWLTATWTAIVEPPEG